MFRFACSAADCVRADHLPAASVPQHPLPMWHGQLLFALKEDDMPYFKRIGLLVLLMVSGLFAYSWLLGVSDGDIYAYHEADFRTGDRLLAPGSIAAVSPRGNISEICSLKADGLSVSRIQTSLYYNVLREDFPGYVRSIKAMAWLIGEANAAPDPETPVIDPKLLPTSGRKFTGSEKVIKDLSMADDFREIDCEEKMAWHLSRGYKVCTVRKSLNARVLDNATGAIHRRTVAVAFAEHSNFVGKSKFNDEDAPYNKLAQRANGKSCDDGSLPWSVRMRRSLEIINRVYLPA